MDSKNEKLIRVFSSANSGEAHLIRNHLEAHGVRARVTGDGLAHSGVAGVANVDVYIFESQAQQARELIDNWTPPAEPVDPDE